MTLNVCIFRLCSGQYLEQNVYFLILFFNTYTQTVFHIMTGQHFTLFTVIYMQIHYTVLKMLQSQFFVVFC